MQEITSNNQQPEEESIDLQNIFWQCLHYWYWFMISLIICIGAVFFYIRHTEPKYTRTAQLLIKTDSNNKHTMSDLAVSGLGDFDLFNYLSNVPNEILTLKSLDNLKDVVTRLNLNTEVYIKDANYDKIAYGDNLPVKIDFIGLPERAKASLDFSLSPDGEVILSNFVRNDGNPGDEDVEINNKVLKAHVNQIISTPIGKVSFLPSKYYTDVEGIEYTVTRIPVKIAAERLQKNLSVDLSEEKSSILDIRCTDPSPSRADDIIMTIVSTYNDKWIEDRNQISSSTSKFIDERLAVIESELGNVDSDISSYKSANLVPDVSDVSKMYMTEATNAGTKIVELNNQIAIGQYVRDFLTDSREDFRIIPANTGFESQGLNAQINEFNNQVTKRNTLLSNSSMQNPVVKEMDSNLADLRRSIISSIDNQIRYLRDQLKSQERKEDRAVAQIANNPQQAKYLLSVERQQKVKEALYLYLLQKREENELSQAFSAYNNRLITSPTGPDKPSQPVKRNLYIIAFVVGLLIPLGIIFLREMFNTKIRGRKDVEGLSAPLIGEIPMYMPMNKSDKIAVKIPFMKSIYMKKLSAITTTEPVVSKDNRNIINEAFRVLRANIDFMQVGDTSQKVYTVTSFNPGSGKSFITINLAMAFAISGKKILVIDGDLRHASISKYFKKPKEGLSDYLAGTIADYQNVVMHAPNQPNLDFIPAGKLPPNPAELLESPKFEVLINGLKDDYDFIFIDCPPTNIVADTHIIQTLSEKTIFVIRAGLLERSMLEELEKYYQEKKFKNMAVVLNGTEPSGNRYGNHYGYGYGYGYGYYHSYYSNA